MRIRIETALKSGAKFEAFQISEPGGFVFFLDQRFEDRCAEAPDIGRHGDVGGCDFRREIARGSDFNFGKRIDAAGALGRDLNGFADGDAHFRRERSVSKTVRMEIEETLSETAEEFAAFFVSEAAVSEDFGEGFVRHGADDIYEGCTGDFEATAAQWAFEVGVLDIAQILPDLKLFGGDSTIGLVETGISGHGGVAQNAHPNVGYGVRSLENVSEFITAIQSFALKADPIGFGRNGFVQNHVDKWTWIEQNRPRECKLSPPDGLNKL